MDTHNWETLGWLVYMFLYFSVVLMYYVFKAALDHGGTSIAAIVLVVFVVLGFSRP